ATERVPGPRENSGRADHRSTVSPLRRRRWCRERWRRESGAEDPDIRSECAPAGRPRRRGIFGPRRKVRQFADLWMAWVLVQPLEIDETAFDVGMGQRDLARIAHIQAFESLDEFTFGRGRTN